MNYVTEIDLINWLGEGEIIALTNPDDPDANTINQVPLNEALTFATNIINTHIYRHYSHLLPFDDVINPIPSILRECAKNLARYHLDRRDDFRKALQVDFDRWMAWLQDIESGEKILPVLQLSRIKVFATPAVFSENNLKGF
jgi:phage gp36-like protein